MEGIFKRNKQEKILSPEDEKEKQEILRDFSNFVGDTELYLQKDAHLTRDEARKVMEDVFNTSGGGGNYIPSLMMPERKKYHKGSNTDPNDKYNKLFNSNNIEA